MSLTKLNDDDCVHIFLDDVEEWLYVDWIGCQSVESVQRGCEQVLEQMQRLQHFRVLNDNSHVLGLWLSASGWVARDWMPRAKAAGMQRLAWVCGPSQYSRVSTDATLAAMDDAEHYGVRVFQEMDEAKEWLREGFGG